MLKAILLVTALGGGGGDYTAEMPSMKECLDARITIAEQDPNVKTLCVPMADDTAKVQEFFDLFMDMIDQLREKELEETIFFNEYVCDSSVEPGVVILTDPPKIYCDGKIEHPLFKE
jgi:hypothetical protein